MKSAFFLVGFLAFAQGGLTPKTFEEERKLNEMRYARMEGWRKEQVVDRAVVNKQIQTMFEKLNEAAGEVRELKRRVTALEATKGNQ